LIIEAKTTFNDLQKPAQLTKTSQLFENLTVKLRNISNNNFWGSRSKYDYSLGLLWSSGDESKSQVLEMCQEYLENIKGLTKDIICIQGYVENELLKSKVYKAISGETLKFPN
jgi:hypothetical protein